MIRLARWHVDDIVAHALKTAPEECCGLLAGTGGDPEDRGELIVREVHRMANVWDGDRTCRYEVDPAAHLRLQRDTRERGLSIVAFYHSHPTGTATPSAFDRELAWPNTVYLIAALQKERELREIRAWRYDADARRFQEEPLHIEPNP